MSNELAPRERIDKAAAGEMTISPDGQIAFSNAAQIMEFAKMMAVSRVAIPAHLRDNPGACMAIAIQATEWRMSPFAVANKSYSVNDRLAYEAQLVNAVILRRAPIAGRFGVSYSGDGPGRKCTVTATLTEGGTVEYESPELQKITVKNSPLWKSDPDQQLFYYTSRAMCRRHFPDVLLGIYTQDELTESAAERTVTGPAVTVRNTIDPFALPAPTQAKPAISARDDFWQQVDAAELSRDDVMTVLVRWRITDEEYPADVSDAELAPVLADPAELRRVFAEARKD